MKHQTNVKDSNIKGFFFLSLFYTATVNIDKDRKSVRKKPKIKGNSAIASQPIHSIILQKVNFDWETDVIIVETNHIMPMLRNS